MDLVHVSHPDHKLSYKKSVNTGEKAEVCAACRDEITSEHYCCFQCNFFLHRLCAERPQELTHSLHPLHPLRLLHKSPYDGGYPSCDACKKGIEGFVYHCAICQFDLDFICAFPDGLKVNHLSHPEHVLTFEKVVRTSDKEVICVACHEEISGQSAEHYSCRRCDVFLHKLCSEAPLELTHSSHIHPLQLIPENPYSSEDATCDVCQCILNGALYHCNLCNEFTIHLGCAVPNLKPDYSAFSGEAKLNHVLHPDHELSYKKSVKRGKKAEDCAACRDEISSEHYCCSQCNFVLHKFCAERPLKLSHSLHSLHPLRLLHKSSSDCTICDACKKTVEGFVYHCAICDFYLDIICAFPDELKLNHISHGWEKLYHVCHPHSLTFEMVVKRADPELVCAACLEDISGPLADYYSCRRCNFFLHQSCGKRPWELIHPLHSEHTLHLLKRDPYRQGTSDCRSCWKPMKGLVYDCRQCNKFSIDFKCAFSKPEKHIQYLEQIHDHPLAFHTRLSNFICDLCVSDGEEQSYACFTCDFMIHRSCATRKLIQWNRDHAHPLSLVLGVPEDLCIYPAFFCKKCKNSINPEDVVAYCSLCWYFVHIRCMIIAETAIINTIMDDVDYLNTSLIQIVLNGDDFVHWPPSDLSSELIQPFLLGKNGIVMNTQPKIQHFSHKEHDMILFQELSVNNDGFFKEEDEEVLCDACIHPVTAPYYSCQGCDYYLHLSCANLPSKISHSSHPQHELDLCYGFRCYYCFNCDRCKQDSNGFAYWCRTCNLYLDLTCAALPAVIMHETHEHLLIQRKQEHEGLCYCCNTYGMKGDNIFKCRSCDFYLHYNCAMYSRSIRHRWDRQHPLDLRYPPHVDHPHHFMCDMCEELIHPASWLFSCFKCEISFHTRCSPKYQCYPNMKYGGEVKTSFHPHILKYLKKATLKITCDRCEGQLDCSDVFECETCYYCICYKCVIEEQNNSKALRIKA